MQHGARLFGEERERRRSVAVGFCRRRYSAATGSACSWWCSSGAGAVDGRELRATEQHARDAQVSDRHERRLADADRFAVHEAEERHAGSGGCDAAALVKALSMTNDAIAPSIKPPKIEPPPITSRP